MLARSLRARTGCVIFVALFVLGVGVVALSHWQETQRTSSTASEARTGSSMARTSLSSPSAATVVIVAGGCVEPNSTGSHVYHPDRLKILQPCITVTGRIEFIRHEPDGDYHVGLKLDPQFHDLVNSCNSTCLDGAEHGDLVVEPVCMTTPTQADAVGACSGYRNPIVIPPVGSHVSMTGAYVLDLDHGWTEIHPLQEVHVL